MVADVASRYNYGKLANLGLQVSTFPKPADLRQKLNSFSTTPLCQALGGTTIKSSSNMHRSVKDTATFSSFETASHWITRLLFSVKPATVTSYLGALRSHHIQAGVDTIGIDDDHITLISKGGQRIYEEGKKTIIYPSYQTSMRLITMAKEGLTSNRHSVWHLLRSFDLETLHGIHGPPIHISHTFRADTLPSTPPL